MILRKVMGSRIARLTAFGIIQVSLFLCVFFTDGYLIWIPLLLIFAIINFIVASALKNQQNGFLKKNCFSVITWSFSLSIVWFVVYWICGVATGLFGWVYAAMLYSLPLGAASGSLLFTFALIPLKKKYY